MLAEPRRQIQGEFRIVYASNYEDIMLGVRRR